MGESWAGFTREVFIERFKAVEGGFKARSDGSLSNLGPRVREIEEAIIDGRQRSR